DPSVKVGRIQNFKNWSPDMVPDPTRSTLGLEYFCAEGDDLWRMADRDLVELAKRELERIGLVSADEVEDGCVFAVPKAYPIYDADSRSALATVREFVDSLENFQTIGRNGLHRYNNQDHAMLTGMQAARNVALAEANDVWAVNVDEEYHEEVHAESSDEDIEEAVTIALTHVFEKLDGVALGVAVGTVGGLALFVVTAAAPPARPAPPPPPLRPLGPHFPPHRGPA